MLVTKEFHFIYRLQRRRFIDFTERVFEFEKRVSGFRK